MPHFVYILYSRKFNRFYVGVTLDLSKRILQHNNKENPSTAGGVPWILIWNTFKESRLKAESLEQKLKHLSRVRKIKFMHKYHEGITDQDLFRVLSHLIK